MKLVQYQCGSIGFEPREDGKALIIEHDLNEGGIPQFFWCKMKGKLYRQISNELRDKIIARISQALSMAAGYVEIKQALGLGWPELPDVSGDKHDPWGASSFNISTQFQRLYCMLKRGNWDGRFTCYNCGRDFKVGEPGEDTFACEGCGYDNWDDIQNTFEEGKSAEFIGDGEGIE